MDKKDGGSIVRARLGGAMKQIIKITVFDKEQYDGEWPPEDASGAVQWLEGGNGELLIFTRAEYRQTLMSNIHSLPGNKVHFFQGEAMPTDGEG